MAHLAVTLAMFVMSKFAIRLIPNQFFPSSDRPELLVDMTLPQNASIFASESVARRIDEVLKDDPDVARWSTSPLLTFSPSKFCFPPSAT